MIELVRRQYREALGRCTDRPGCKAELHHSTCAEFRHLIRRDP